MTTYDLHVRPEILAAGRRFINTHIIQGTGDDVPHRVLSKLLVWRKQALEHWQSFHEALVERGPGYVVRDEQMHLSVAYMTAIGEVLVVTVDQLETELSPFDDSLEDEWRERFDDFLETYLQSLAFMINALMTSMRAGGAPTDTDDALEGRLHNLDHARHLCVVASNVVCPNDEKPEGDYRHPNFESWIKLSSVVDRSMGVVLNERAKRREKDLGSRKSLKELLAELLEVAPDAFKSLHQLRLEELLGSPSLVSSKAVLRTREKAKARIRRCRN